MSRRQGTHVSLKRCFLIGLTTLGLMLAACSGNWQELLGEREGEKTAHPEALTAPKETTAQAGWKKCKSNSWPNMPSESNSKRRTAD